MTITRRQALGAGAALGAAAAFGASNAFAQNGELIQKRIPKSGELFRRSASARIATASARARKNARRCATRWRGSSSSAARSWTRR